MSNNISPHFKRSEFECQCGCGFDSVDVELIRVLELVRQHFLTPVIITSGCRCENHNYQVGGSPKSQHLYGRAADFKVEGKAPAEVYNFLDTLFPDVLGLGLYDSWVHLDTRTDAPVRWGNDG